VARCCLSGGAADDSCGCTRAIRGIGFISHFQPFVPTQLACAAATVVVTAVSPALTARTADRPTSIPNDELLTLVDRARIGDMAAQSELVRRYTPRIAGFVRPIISQPSATEDVVQMIFIKMVRRLRLLRSSAAFESWLFRLSRNTALDFIRRRRCRPTTVADDRQMADVPDTDSSRTVDEIMEAFELAVSRLSPLDRHLVTMIVQGHSYRTVAAQSGLTEGAVKVRLCRMRPFLRSTVGTAIGPRLGAAVPFAPGRSQIAA
jgi:RNA polymerase sigma-70 factor, ECF subfamily